MRVEQRIRPMGPRVLVRCEKRVVKTSGNIILPAEFTAIEKVQERAGRVVRKPDAPREGAPARRDNPRGDAHIQDLMSQVEVGDRVLFRGFIADMNDITEQAGFEDGEGNHYSIIDIEDILAIIGDDVAIGAFKATAA